jgi:acyl-CoA synthetase (AMP-forming)/AMP-acid ligase II
VIGERGEDVPDGQEGELVVAGAPVMQGYWDRPEETERAFLTDASGQWYRTGDIVVVDGDGNYEFRGRRDRMVKRRGYRVELGEIEAALHDHPSVEEAAVVAGVDAEGAVLIRAFLHSRDGGRLSLVELKRFCADRLPLYMVPDRFSFVESLPRTSTDKVDYQRLKVME